MSINIRNTDNIQGLAINRYKLKTTQYADDTTLYLKDSTSLKHTFKLLDHFHLCAGLKLNKEKNYPLNWAWHIKICN